MKITSKKAFCHTRQANLLRYSWLCLSLFISIPDHVLYALDGGGVHRLDPPLRRQPLLLAVVVNYLSEIDVFREIERERQREREREKEIERDFF